MKKLLLFVIFIFCAFNILYAQEGNSLTDNPIKVTEYVTDLTGTLKTDELSALRMKLRKFFDSTSTQIVVLIIPSLNGEPVENVANAIFRFNGIGTKSKNNGVLLLISKGDRKIRLEVGYGLEGIMPDAISKQIIKNDIGPELKKDNYFKGIENGVNAIIAISSGEYKASPKQAEDHTSENIVFLVIVIIFVGIIGLIIFLVVKKSKNITWTKSSGSSSGYYSSSSSSDSSWSSSGSSDSSSSSDSGFTGGGGDSGGGGASGDY